MSSTAATGRKASRAPEGLPRLLRVAAEGKRSSSLEAHLDYWGWVPAREQGPDLTEAIERSGLRGRGGAAFPTATKWKAVSANGLRRPAVVANASESEPASAKDRLLLTAAPHLVLDGLALAAQATGAVRAVAHVPDDLAARVVHAVRERQGVDRLRVEVVPVGGGYLSGEESAVVSHLNGAPPGTPMFTRLRPVYHRGVGGRPTLVQNAETLAHVALIARFGPSWFRELGTRRSPGTALLTVRAGDRWQTVVEISLGTPLGAVLGSLRADPQEFQAVLMGGYAGAWLAMEKAVEVSLSEDQARQAGSTLGAGVLVLLRHGVCPLAEVARLTRFMQQQSAGQCGPCVNGLAGLADATEDLAWSQPPGPGVARRVQELCSLVEGRGACRHPDGVVRMVRSALGSFSSHLDSHLSHGPCAWARQRSIPQQSAVREPVRYVEGA